MQERDTLKTVVTSKDSEISDLNSKIESLEKEIKELNKKHADQTKKFIDEAANNKKALEKAITSSVRLCVVAPTVNVHVNDAKQKFKSK
jgi:predicted  nucleic acid-binding Zn-ribbon protein